MTPVQTVQDRFKTCRSLPTIPSVAVQVLDLCEAEDVGIPELAAILMRDPALTAKVLKIANSPLYGVRTQVTTVDRAVSLLGVNATLSLALSFSFVGSMRKSGKRSFNHEAYWRRSVITAATAKALGSVATSLNREELFLAGLLQDIGMLVMNEAFPGEYGKVVAKSDSAHRRLVELEHETFGTDHAAAGSWLLQRWNVPDSLRIAVARSHERDFQESWTSGLAPLSAFAGLFAEVWANPDTAGAMGEARALAVEKLGMPVARLDALISEVAVSLPEVTAFLDIDIGGESGLQHLLDQAREALVVLNLQAQQQTRVLQDLAHHDGLTSLYNRGYFEEIFPQMFEAACRLSLPLSVVLVDLDHFKSVNDRYGHQAGDSILVSVARILHSVLRAADIPARYGGEEFVCILYNTPLEGARTVAERIRIAVESAPHKLTSNAEVVVTVSAGCATYSADHIYPNARTLIAAADRHLYAAKAAGRNCVVVDDD